MREYSNKISLSKNYRGVYSLDTFIGCEHGIKSDKKGCYNDCYAARYAKRYGYDFSKSAYRYFTDEKHVNSIVKKINKKEVGFIRIGTSGDPSYNWSHTLETIETLRLYDVEKDIVVITKHFNNLKKDELRRLKNCNIIVNTSISALDLLGDNQRYYNAIYQYNKLKTYCKSVLRVVTCDFNIYDIDGKWLNDEQNRILKEYECIETALRVSPKNKHVESGLINYKSGLFLGEKCNFSLRSKNIHIGLCKNCKDKCGIKRSKND